MSYRMSFGVVEARVTTLNTLRQRTRRQPGYFYLAAEFGEYVIYEVINEEGGVHRHTAGRLRECKQFVDGVIVGVALTKAEVS